MTVIGLIVIVAVVAIVFLGLGMAISNNHQSQAPEHSPHTRAHRGGWGAGTVLVTVLCLLGVAVVGWTSVWSVEESSATVVDASPQPRTTTRLLPPQPPRPPVPTEVPAPVQTGEVLVARTEPEAAAVSDGDYDAIPHRIVRIESAAPHETEEAAIVIKSVSARTSSSPTPFQFKPDLAVWLIVSMFGLALLIGAGVWIAHRRQHWSLSGMARSTVRSFWVVPMLASVGWVGYQIWPHLSVEPLARNIEYNAAQHEFDRSIDETQSQFSLPATTTGMPAWVTEGITAEYGLVHVPVHGGWRESQDEARNEAQAQALRTITEDFAFTYPSAADWRMDVPLKDLHAVAEEAVETKYFNFGNTEEPMYRMHLLVELSDEVRSELVNRWKPELQEYRMGMLLTFGGLLSLVCFAGGTCLNLDLRTDGHYRRWLRTATVLIVVAAAAVAHGVLNSLWFQHSV